MDETFDNIWYLPSENTWQDFHWLAYRDTGSLTVADGVIAFTGRKGTVRIVDIAEVSYGKQGRDFVNNWVKVRSKSGELAFFADGGWRGWRGILGGTKRVFRAVQNLRLSAAG